MVESYIDSNGKVIFPAALQSRLMTSNEFDFKSCVISKKINTIDLNTEAKIYPFLIDNMKFGEGNLYSLTKPYKKYIDIYCLEIIPKPDFKESKLLVVYFEPTKHLKEKILANKIIPNYYRILTNNWSKIEDFMMEHNIKCSHLDYAVQLVSDRSIVSAQEISNQTKIPINLIEDYQSKPETVKNASWINIEKMARLFIKKNNYFVFSNTLLYENCKDMKKDRVFL